MAVDKPFLRTYHTFECPNFSSLSVIKIFHKDLHCGSKHFLTRVSFRLFAKKRICGTFNTPFMLVINDNISANFINCTIPVKKTKKNFFFGFFQTVFLGGGGSVGHTCTNTVLALVMPVF